MRDKEHFAASFEQERAYVLDRLGAGDAVHRAWTLEGALPVETVRQALAQLTERHEILRTHLHDTAAELVQIVRDRVDADFGFEDLSEADDRDRRARQLAASFAQRPFDLGAAPLWRVLLMRLRADRHVVVLSMHAAVADTETVVRLFEELLECVTAGRTGETATAAPRQYREHAARQRALDAGAMAEQEAYWLGHLEGELLPAELPVSRRRPADRTSGCGRHRRLLPAALAAEAERLAEDVGCSLSAVLTAGFAALLYRYGARSEVTFGSPLSTRRGPSGETMLGNCENLAVMRLALRGDTTFEETVRLTADRLARAEANRDYPYQRLLRALGMPWDARVPPVFRILFDPEPCREPARSLSRPGELVVDDFDVPPSSAAHDLRAIVRPTAQGLALDWIFDTGVFEPELIAQVADHFVGLLSAAVEEPGAPVATLAFLSPADMDAIRRRWNTARTPYRRHCAHRLIEEQVARTPETVAVEFADRRLSYSELNRRANRLARHLVSLGASRGDMVGLCMDRSADLVVAVVAILKAGCVVVPLDAAYPPDRLRFMLQDAGVRTVVTARVLVERVAALAELFEGLTRVEVDADRSVIARAADHDLEDGPEDGLPPEAAAYCIYTSGSTGRPKGVVVEHAALANLVQWHLDTWLTGVGIRTLLYSPISFDVAFHELLAGLCSGATLMQIDEDTRRNPMALLEFVRQRRVEKWYMPFVTLQQVAQAARTSAAPEHLKELIVGGEVLRITPEIRDFARRTGCVIRNHYGSTECIDVATHTLSGDPDLWPDVVPIGRANVHNMNLYILDDARQLVPVGVVGEIYGEGDSLARGYHGRPELTRERFVSSPFGTQGARLYRTGDLGRYLPDGTIECLGRVDNQVKIRGFRVEPSEVEAVLAQHPAVAECAVAAKAGNGGRARLLAYVVLREGRDGSAAPEELRVHLAERLPGYMVPAAVVVLGALPLTPSGKVDVRGLPDVRPRQAEQPPRVSGDLRESISRIWSELLETPEIDAGKTFFELGGDSVLLVRAHQRIAEAVGRELPVDTLFRHPTVEALARFLEKPDQRSGDAEPEDGRRDDRPAGAPAGRDLAVIGMACRVPGADDVTRFWSNLRDGVESVRTLPPSEILELDTKQTRDPHFVPRAAMIPGIDLFDAAFFGYSPAEAAVIDPQQRLFLECAWEAIEDAGVDTGSVRVGVYAGASLSTYLVNNVLPAKLRSGTFLSHRQFDEATELRIEQGNARDHLPTRVSFKLDLRGPSVNVQSTCSTSLVAVHMARQALLDGDCDVALAGGVSIITPQNTGYLWRDGMMVSPDGRCRAFDAEADGTVFGNGLGAVVLKPLSRAIADGDHIYAVIKGSAVNNDGALKMDYTGPSVEAQAEVVAMAHRSAGVSADEISYVEAHGTGTKLGDPVEIAGLTEAFRRSAGRGGAYCAIGSVKTNIGHLDEAAGVIGLIKTALSLYHREIPPSLHYRSPNPLAGLETSPFYVNTRLRHWETPDGRPRRAGVSSFGMGGTNCHVVLEEPPAVVRKPPEHDRPVHILPVSARSADALRGTMHRYLRHLEGQDDAALPDICFSAATGRRHFGWRVAVLAGNVEDARSRLAEMLAAPDLAEVASHVGDRPPPVAFLFTGQGSQYTGMGGSLYETQPVFREAVDRCDEILRPLIGRSLVSMLYGPDPVPLDGTETAQPALFAVGYALSRLWKSWGVEPDLLVGHSLGEYVAACVAGVFSLEDGLKLVAARARLMADLPRTGGMLQVNAGVEKVAPYLEGLADAVSTASVNAPDLTVISGRSDVLEAVRRELLRKEGVDALPLDVSHAFHSPLMEPVLEPFRAVAETVRYSPPSIDIVSNVTGAPAGPGDMESAGYWVRHVVEPVRFDQAVRVADERGIRLFVELGPKPTLINLARRRLRGRDALWLPSLTPRDPHAAVAGLRELYLAGAQVDWSGFDAPFRRRRKPLPTYAFQRRRHWLGPDPTAAEPASGSRGDAATPAAPAGRSAAPQALTVTWEPATPGPAPRSAGRRFVVMGGQDGLAARLAHRLRERGHACAEVVAYGDAGPGADPSPDGVSPARLSEALAGVAGDPEGLHLVFAPECSGVTDVPAAAARLLADARAILEFAVGSPPAAGLWFVTRSAGLDAPATEAELAQSGLAALARTVNTEHPELACVALTLPAAGDGDLDVVAGLLEGGAPEGEEQLAVHEGRVWQARLEALPALPGSPGETAAQLPIRPGGVYLITGGTGALGLRLAAAVARFRPRRLVLVSRHGESRAGDEAAAWAELEATGVRVDTVRADVADEARMREILAGCGPDLRGVFHCAGVLDDGILLRQTSARMSGVLRPKAAGAWVLHRLTEDRDLDFFVLFSSLASVLGYPGQGGYAAANGFLDALARYRRRRGLPALSVSWGSWAGAGMTARLTPGQRARLRDEGERPIPREEGLAALAALMTAGPPHAAVAAVDWPDFAASRARRPAMLKALLEPRPEPDHAAAEAPFAARLREAPPEDARRILRDTVTAIARSLLGDETARVDPARGLAEMGLDSLGALDLRGRLQTELGLSLPATLAFEHPCVDALVRHLEEHHFTEEIQAVPDSRPAAAGDLEAGRAEAAVVKAADTAAETAPQARRDPAAEEAVAIIGMSCRFPGAASPEEFWKLLVEGRDAGREIPGERWDLDRLYDPSPDAPGKMYVRRMALIDDAECFDAAFFGISPREAAAMDPSHRLLLEAAWGAVEGAGIDPASLRGSDTGVYLGCDQFTNDYLRLAERGLGSEPYIATGTTLSFSAGRLSYKLGLHGPSMVIAAACSSSLVALHSAVRAIRHGECGMAIVGGAKLMLGPEETVQLCKLRALAPDGRSKAFSAGADGFGRGEGCAALLLKRLDRALADGDPVLAVIRGTAVNHDGPSSGLTVPNAAAQARLVAGALEDARVDPADVTYVETHGTGTQLGDPIELRALGETFGGRARPLLIGSVKANIGHLEEAAGLAGVIKVMLALRDGFVPPQIHCDVLTDKVDWDSLPLVVQRTGIAWPPDAPRIAGVSSFGMSGTNAHVVLEAFTPPPPRACPGPFVFPFSARDETDLVAAVRRFAEALTVPYDPGEVAYTLQTGRSHHRLRLAVVAPGVGALRARLEAFLQGSSGVPGLVRGEAGDGEERRLGADEAARLIERQDLAGIAQAWCDGHAIGWRDLYAAEVPRRIPLPAYPFKRQRIRIGEELGRVSAPVPGTVAPAPTPAPATPNPAPSAPSAPPVAPEPAAAPAASGGGRDVVDDLRGHVAELLGMAPDDLTPAASLHDLGADSLTFMRVSQFIRDRFQTVIPFQQLVEETSTLRELASLVAAHPAAPPPAPSAAAPAAPPPSERGFASGPSALRTGPQTTERLTDRQARFLSELVEAYTARTRGSKREAERDRPVMTNCRMPPFQALCKEMSYPIVVERSSGARFWDVDGNEYVDISMGYGVHLFGHQPSFVAEALRAQIDDGFHIGPQAVQAGRVSRLLCELTGMQRAAFCNSGTEAVMAALRFARAATARTRFVMFEGSYHGWSDGTLALPAGPRASIPMARGVGAGAMDDVVVLEYGTRESLETIRELGPELAAVLVEPVQSRRPDLQPTAFLRELREATRATGTALIFDEVITGFRVGPGGAQAWSGVDADLAVYGKILGGGTPIGAVAGRARFMDTVDGGAWNYGDDSRPTVPMTFFGGTFNKNPLSMAAAEAVLSRLKAEGPELQRRVAEKVDRLADDFNAFCRREGFPLRIVHFSSLFRFIGEGEYSLQRFPIAIDLFFHMLALKGIYVLETRVCFLSTSHTTDDVEFVSETAKSCLRALRDAGFLPRATASVPAPAAPATVAPAGAGLTRRLAEDARLDPAFAVPRSAPPASCEHVLLTGATGFLGAHLVKDLLRATSARIHCLVRAEDGGHARDRVIDNLAAHGCLDDGAYERVVGVPADLSLPRLGLADPVWRRLAEQIDAIYHNGAQVNSLLPYDKLRAANVEGTRELLRLAVDGRTKAFHHVSSDAVFDAYGYHRHATIYEDEPLAHSETLYGGGYAESKWVADKLVERARAAGLPASVYRPGMITAAVSGGCGQPGDFLTRFIAGIVRMGVCPETDATIDFAPVDYVSQMIVKLSAAGGAGRTFHLTHPDPITYRAFVDAIRDAGYELEVVPLHVWDRALATLRYEDDNPLYPLLPLFTESSDPVFRRSRLDTRHARAGAAALYEACPPLLELIPVYLERFRDAGYLKRR
ncbi:amino acid adenylation domain-containing protein [Microbispora sp. NPDC046933]|uniref:non-ribosomal peptide synthetase/type I polyketide synthase n=1 Tax=Microbispora sp. NPDC046933 TaxID=3155618 RepID=UPI0033E1D3E4